MRAWRGPHRIFHTLQDGRVYILDTGQKVHFERLKPHNSSPLEFAATPLDTGDIAVVMDPEPERSMEPIDDDCSKPSYHSEPLLSEASDVSLPSRKRHWMDIRLRAKLRAGGARQHYQQFEYSTSGTDDETSDAMLPIPTHSPQLMQTQPTNITDMPAQLSDTSMFDCLPQLFSDHEPRRSPSPQLSPSDNPPELSPSGTSAPLLTHPSLTDYLSNYPLWHKHAKDTDAPTSGPPTPQPDQNLPSIPNPPTAPSVKRGRGRPRKKKRATKAPRPRKPSDKTASKVYAPISDTHSNTQTGTQNRYQLRHKRQPRYKCGTCGLRDCVCVLAVHENREVPIGARGVPPEGRHNAELVHRVVVRAEKTSVGIERAENYLTETILQQIAVPDVAKAPCPRFKEWTSDGKGLEFTLATVVPPVPPSIVFGPFNFEREPVQMARGITADLLLDRYGVEVEPGGVYSPAPHWWLLVTAPRVDALVEPRHLLLCLESLRTSTTEHLILCFHLLDWYRGKVKFRWWLELIITCFTDYPRIRLLDEWIHTFEEPLQVRAALNTLDTWVRASVDNQALPRSVWQDLAAIQCRTPRVCLPPDNGPDREIVYPGSLRPNMVEYISYDTTDFLQVEGHIALACPADLETSSAALRYVLRECGKEQVFSLRPRVGEIVPLTPAITNKPAQTIHLLITRANQRAPLMADDFLLCMPQLTAWLEDRGFA